MRRRFAGRLGHDGADPRLAAALDPAPARLRVAGPLLVSYAGAAAGEGGILCLLDGILDDTVALAEELEAPTGLAAEGLAALGWRRWGVDLLPRLRGDFALLLWDAGRKEGLLARDQLGARCVYLHGDPAGELRFATEIADLLRLLPSRPGPDSATLAHWLVASTRPAEATLYAGIRRLAPGSALLLGRHGGREVPYWRPRYQGALDLPAPALAELVSGGLERSIARRAAAGPTALLLSGGLDSASIAALAPPDEAPLACSATFPDHPEADESDLLLALGEHLGLDQVLGAVRPGGLLAAQLAYLKTWQLPQLGWGDFWASELMRVAAARGVVTVLDGNGGDELFAPRSYLIADRLRGGHPLGALALAKALPGAGRAGHREVAAVFRRLGLAGALPPWAAGPQPGRRTGREAPTWLRSATRRALADSDDPEAWKDLDGPRWWAHAADGVGRAIERGGFFEHQRHRAAALGLEARHPMLDLDLVELGLRQPPEATIDPRFNRPLLRAATENLLPDAIRLRPGKAWFHSVIADSLAGPDGNLARALLTDPAAELGAYIDLGAMARALFDDGGEAHRRDPFRWMAQVWRLLGAECWLRSQTISPSQILPPGEAPSTTRVEIAEGNRSDFFQP